MNEDLHETEADLLSVRIGRADEPIDLMLLEQLAERLRSAFREITRERSGNSKAQVTFLVHEIRKGSIVLMVEPLVEGEGVPSAQEVAGTLISDINDLGERRARANMSANLLGHYREIVKISERAGKLELGFDGSLTTLGPENQVAFDAALREQPEAGVEIVGTIETLNIHTRPWRFGLYTKLDRQRVECRFSDEMLDDVLKPMDLKTLVLVRGEARFAQVGITARTIDLTLPPVPLTFDSGLLRSYRRGSNIALEGETAADAIVRIREELATYG